MPNIPFCCTISWIGVSVPSVLLIVPPAPFPTSSSSTSLSLTWSRYNDETVDTEAGYCNFANAFLWTWWMSEWIYEYSPYSFLGEELDLILLIESITRSIISTGHRRLKKYIFWIFTVIYRLDNVSSTKPWVYYRRPLVSCVIWRRSSF